MLNRGELRSLRHRYVTDRDINDGQIHVAREAEGAWGGGLGFFIKKHSKCIILGETFVGRFRMVWVIVGRDKFYYAVVTRFGLRYVPVYSLEGNNVCQL